MTCGIRNSVGINETGFCPSGHDNWLEYRDVMQRNEWFRAMVAKTGLSEREFTDKFLDKSVKQFQLNHG
jgi:hypothetical protein